MHYYSKKIKFVLMINFLNIIRKRVIINKMLELDVIQSFRK